MTASIAGGAHWAADAHRASLLGTGDEEPEEVLSVVTMPLLAAGREEICASSSELGDTEVLLSRRGQVLTAAYRPLTREVVLAGGRSELDVLCELVADDGGLMKDPEGVSLVDRAAIAADWGDPVLTEIAQHLRDELADDRALADPSSDDDWNLTHRQVIVNLSRTALLGS